MRGFETSAVHKAAPASGSGPAISQTTARAITLAAARAISAIVPATALIFALVGTLVGALGSAPAQAAGATVRVPLDDSRQGMTCHFYAAAARLAWRNAGGDWRDADSRAMGDRPFSTTQVGVRKGLQEIVIDAKGLAQAWNDGHGPAGGIVLRAIGSAGVVNIASREEAESSQRPMLQIEWSDGQRQRLSPSADAHTACPTHKGLGASKLMKIGANQIVILVFPFEPRPKRTIARATLRLVSNRQYHRSTEIGSFLLDVPASHSVPQPGIATGFPADIGIDNHPDVIHFEGFESPRWASAWSDIDRKPGAHPVSSAPGERFEALQGKALKATVPKGSRTGLNMHFRLARHGDEPEELYFRYYLRFGDSWDPVVTGGKLPGLSGTYGRAGWGGRGANGTDGWSARGAFFQQLAKNETFSRFRGIGSYVYHKTSGKYGSVLGWNLGPTGLLEKNRWYAIEQSVKMNTPGKEDGVLRAWIDGRLAFEKTDLHFRDIPELRIESVWMNVYHGGIDDAHKDLSLFIDNVVIARRYIGPMAP